MTSGLTRTERAPQEPGRSRTLRPSFLLASVPAAAERCWVIAKVSREGRRRRAVENPKENCRSDRTCPQSHCLSSSLLSGNDNSVLPAGAPGVLVSHTHCLSRLSASLVPKQTISHHLRSHTPR